MLREIIFVEVNLNRDREYRKQHDLGRKMKKKIKCKKKKQIQEEKMRKMIENVQYDQKIN